MLKQQRLPQKGPGGGRPPSLPAPLPKPEGPLQVERRPEGAGSGGSRCPGPQRRLGSCPLGFRVFRWKQRRRRLWPRGGSSCQLPAPARRPAARPAPQRGGTPRAVAVARGRGGTCGAAALPCPRRLPRGLFGGASGAKLGCVRGVGGGCARWCPPAGRPACARSEPSRPRCGAAPSERKVGRAR